MEWKRLGLAVMAAGLVGVVEGGSAENGLLLSPQVTFEPVAWEPINLGSTKPDSVGYTLRKYGQYKVYSNKGNNSPYIEISGEFYKGSSNCLISSMNYKLGLFFISCGTLTGDYGEVVDLRKHRNYVENAEFITYENGKIYLLTNTNGLRENVGVKSYQRFPNPEVTIFSTEGPQKQVLTFSKPQKVFEKYFYFCLGLNPRSSLRVHNEEEMKGFATLWGGRDCPLKFELNLTTLKGRYRAR